MIDQLGLLADLSIALLGFSGIVVSLGSTNFSEEGYSKRIAALLWGSLVAFIGSILPILNVPIVVASMLLISLSTLLLAWATRTFVLGGNLQRTDTIAPLLFGLLTPAIVVAAWLAYCVVFDRSMLEYAYLSVVGCWLIVAASTFVRLVLALDFKKRTDDT